MHHLHIIRTCILCILLTHDSKTIKRGRDGRSLFTVGRFVFLLTTTKNTRYLQTSAEGLVEQHTRLEF
ncbi:hypothetical protein Hanom_Chr01g00057031 [Helianthus anomalus]